MKRALITGATGFLGSHIARRLLSNNWEITAITNGSPKLRLSPQEANSIQWVGSAQKDKEIFEKKEIDLFINCAIQYQTPENPAIQPEETNVNLPLEITKKIQATGQKTTSIVFDSFFSKYPDESTPQPTYTNQKKTLIELLKKQQKSTGNRSIVIRLEHLYGPNDNPRKIIPTVARELLSGKKRISLTDALAKRDLIYIDDAVDAVMHAYEAAPPAFTLVDCGTGKFQVMREVFDLLKELTRSDSILGYGDISTHDHIKESKANIELLREWGWAPKTNLKDGLMSVVLDTQSRP